MKILQKAKKIWRSVDGYKTFIGVAVRFGVMGVNAFFPQALTPDQYQFLLLTGDLISGIGVTDKLRKMTNEKFKKIVP